MTTSEPTLWTRVADGAFVGTWLLDQSQSTVVLRTRHTWGLLPLKAAFSEVAGEGVVSPTGTVTGTLTVGTASIDTKNKKRDSHLRSPDFFHSEAHPHFVFTLGTLTPTDAGVVVTGTLQVRDRTEELTFPANVSVSGEDIVQVDAEVPIDRSDFGLTWNRLGGIASMKSTVAVHAVFTRS